MEEVILDVLNNSGSILGSGAFHFCVMAEME